METPPSLTFEPIDLPATHLRCIEFRRDADVASFGHADRFHATCGADGAGYLTWLAGLLREWPEGCLHVWQGADLVGQMEVHRLPGSARPRRAKVALYYVVPASRSLGIGRQMDAHARALMARVGIEEAVLAVSPTNPRAQAFYVRQGWAPMPSPPIDGGMDWFACCPGNPTG